MVRMTDEEVAKKIADGIAKGDQNPHPEDAALYKKRERWKKEIPQLEWEIKHFFTMYPMCDESHSSYVRLKNNLEMYKGLVSGEIEATVYDED